MLSFDEVLKNRERKKQGKAELSDFDRVLANRQIDKISDLYSSWAEGTQGYVDSYNSRYFDKDGKYVQQYHTDHSDYSSQMSKQKQSLTDTSSKIQSLLDEYGIFYDKEYVTQLSDALQQGNSHINDIYSGITSHDEFYKTFATEADYKKALAEQKEYEELLNLDTSKREADIDDYANSNATLKAQAESYETLANNVANLEVQIRNLRQEINDNAYAATYNEDERKKQDERKQRLAVWEAALKEHSGKNYASEASKLQKQYDDGLAELNAKYDKAEKVQTANRINERVESAKSDPEYDKYVKEGESVDNPSVDDSQAPFAIGNWKPFGDGEKIKNPVTFYLDNKAAIEISMANNGRFEEYDPIIAEMSQEQVDNYNYLYGKFGRTEADLYLEQVREKITGEKNLKFYQDWLEDKWLAEILYSGVVGLDQFANGLQSALGIEQKGIYDQQVIGALVREDLADVGNGVNIFGSSLGQAVYDIGTTTANMAPSIVAGAVVGTVNPAAGAWVTSALMGVSAGGNAYQEAINLGYTKEQARAYGVMTGASEALLSRVLGGVGNAGSSLTNKAVSKMVSGINNAYLRGSVKLLGRMGSEALEESMQEVLNPFIQNLTLNTNNTWSDVKWSEVAYAGLLGALSAGILEGVGTYSAEIKTNKAGQAVIDAGQVSNLVKLGKSMSVDSVAYELAGKVNENTGAYTIGRLLYEAGADSMSETNLSDITQSLINKGVAPEHAKTIAKWMNKAVSGQTLTNKQQAALNDNEVLGEVVRDVIINKNSTVNQRLLGYDEIVKTTSFNQAVEKANKQAAKAEKKAARKGAKNAENSTESIDPDAVEGEYTTDAETAVKSKFDTNTDGQTINNKTGDIINVQEIASIKDGKMTLKLDNGETVNADDVSLPTDKGLLYSAVLDMGVNAEVANQIVKKFDPKGKLPVDRFILGMQEAYKYGKYNIPVREMSGKTFSADLSVDQRTHAYQLGQSDARAESAKAQKTINEAVKNSGKKDGKKGEVHFDGDRTALTKRHRVSLDVLGKIADSIGVDFHIFESRVENNERVYTDEDGNVKPAPNGMYYRDGSIHIDLNAGINGKGTILFTAAHELTHYIKQWSPAKFKVLADFLMEQYGKKGVSVDALVKQQIDKAKRNRDYEMTYDEAFEEVVAESMESMLTDGKVVEKLAMLKEQDKGLVNKIKQFFNKMAKAIREVYAGLNPNSQEGRYVAQMKDAIEHIQSLFTDALVDASENYASAKESINSDEAKLSERDFSYNELIKKSDLKGGVINSKQVVKLTSDGSIDRDWVVSEVLKQCDSIQTKAPVPTYYVSVPDIGKKVQIVGDGIKHGFIKYKPKNGNPIPERSMLNARASLDLPQILRNSIEVNRSKRRDNVDVAYSHILIGVTAMEMPNGTIEYYAVRSVVEARKNQGAVLTEANIIGKLHAINAKKIGKPQAQVGKKNAVALASSSLFDYSVADLLNDVKGVFGDTFSTDVYKHFGLTRKSNPFSNHLKYSDRDSSGKELTKGQQEYFKDSKVRDENGNLIVVYHGTQKGGFTVFDAKYSDDGLSLFFADDPAVAQTYADGSGKEIRAGNPSTLSKLLGKTSKDTGLYKGYLNITNPLTVDGHGRSWNSIPLGDATTQVKTEIVADGENIVLKHTIDGQEEIETFSKEELLDDIERFYIEQQDRQDVAMKSDGLKYHDAWQKSLTDSIEGQKDNRAVSFLTKYNTDPMAVDKILGNVNRTANKWSKTNDGTQQALLREDLIGKDKGPATYYNTREIAKIAKERGHDGVIIKNLRDVGGARVEGTDYNGKNIYIAFDSNQIKSVHNTNPTSDPDIRYQDRDSEQEKAYQKVTQQLSNENAKLREDLSSLKELLKLQGKVTNGKMLSKTSLQAVAKRLMTYSNAKGDVSELVSHLNDVYSYILGDEDIAWEGVAEKATGAIDWLIDHEQKVAKRDEYSDMILKEMRTKRISLNDAQKAEAIATYGSLREFRNKVMGSVIIATDGAPLDSVWNDLSRSYPAYFDPETNDANQVFGLVEAIESLRSTEVEDGYYEYEQEMVAQDLLTKVYDAYWDVATLHTVADAKQKQINLLKSKHKQQMDALRQSHKDKDAALRKAYREKMQKLRDTYRESAEAKLKKKSAQYQESRKKAVENRQKTALKQSIKRVVNRLNSLLNKGNKERNVKIGLRDTVSSALDAAEILFNSNITNDDIVRNGIDFATDEDVARLDEYRALLDNRDALIAKIDSITKSEKPADSFAKVEALYADIDKIDARIAKLGKELSNVFAQERARISKATVSSAIDKIAEAYESIKTSEDEYIKNAYDEYVVKRLGALKEDIGGTLIKDMSAAQLQELFDTFTMIAHTVSNANKMFRDGKAEDLAKRVTSVQGQIMSHYKQLKNNPRSGIKNAADFVKMFVWNEMKPLTAFETLGSDAFTELFWDVINAEGKWAKFMEEADQFLDKQRKAYGYKSWDMRSAHEFTLPDGKVFKLTLQDMMSIYAYSKREQAYDHMTKGGFQFSEHSKYKDDKGVNRIQLTGELYATDLATINQIVSALNKIDDGKVIKYVDAVQGYLTDLGKKGNEVSRVLYGIDIFNEKAYFPLMSAKDYRSSVETALNNTQTQVSLKNTGMTKQTVPKAKNPIILQGFDEVAINHIKKMADYTTQVLPIENLRRVFDSVSLADEGSSVATKAIISKVFGTSAEKYFDQYITDLNGGTMADGAKSPTLAMFSKFKATAVGASLSVVVQQPFAVIRAMEEISPKYFLFGEAGQKETKKLYDEIKKYAPVAIIKEMGGFDTGSNRTAQEYLGVRTDKGFKRVRDEVSDKSTWLAGKADELGWGRIWKAVKREVNASNKYKFGSKEFYDACGQRFTEIIVRTQVYDSVNSRSGYMRSKWDLVKFGTAFMGEPTAIVNEAYLSILNVVRATDGVARKKALKKLGRTIGVLSASQILGSLFKSLVYAMRDDDEDDVALLERWSYQFGESLKGDVKPLNLVPYGRDIVSLWEGWDVERPDMALIADFIKSFKKMVDDGATGDEILAFVCDAANIFGIPAKNLVRDGKAIINFFGDIFDDVPVRDIGGAFSAGWEGVDYTEKVRVENAFDKGDTNEVKRIVSGMIEDKQKSGKTDKEAKSAVRSSFTSTYKKQYLEAYADGDRDEMNRIRKLLYATGLYGNLSELDEDLEKWRKDD